VQLKLRFCFKVAVQKAFSVFTNLLNLGWSEKKFFQNRKKCSSKILPNILKLSKKLVLAGCTLWGASNPANLFRGGKIASKCHNSQTTHR